jgi:molecular chaperone GrpE
MNKNKHDSINDNARKCGKCKCNTTHDEDVSGANAADTANTTDNAAAAQCPDDANANQVQKLTDEINELRKLLLQKLADAENLRKRLEREKNDAVKYANGKFAKDLLGVADNFRRVMDTMNLLEEKVKGDTTLAALVDGIALCGKELTSTLERHGVSEISVAVGDAFDPSLHQAMCEVENSDYGPGSIVQLLQSGYMYNDRLLRPAMVSVAKKS